MKTNKEKRFLRVHLWASCAIMFGVGYMVLSQIEHAIIIAVSLTFFGALAKLIIDARLDKLYREGNSH